MNEDQLLEWRKERLRALAEKFEGNAPLGRALGYESGAHVGQMISGHRSITEKTIRKAQSLPGFEGWFDTPDTVTLTAPSIATPNVKFSLGQGESAAQTMALLTADLLALDEGTRKGLAGLLAQYALDPVSNAGLLPAIELLLKPAKEPPQAKQA